jgi:FkbM family methyltransferase
LEAGRKDPVGDVSSLRINTINRFARDLFLGTPLFVPAYELYHFLANHAYWQEMRSARLFYRQFVHPGSLVFDIGANIGLKAMSFLRLGASVVAVEPVPICVERLRKMGSKRLTVLPCAAGPTNGMATLHVAPRETQWSTLSEKWLAIAKKSERFACGNWSEHITVPTITLDSLIERHGKPDFIKIDVEGFESDVLNGLSSLPCPLSFEFNSEYLSATAECLGKACFRGAKFNFSLEDRLELPTWVSASELLAKLHGTAGDIFVRAVRA